MFQWWYTAEDSLHLTLVAADIDCGPSSQCYLKIGVILHQNQRHQKQQCVSPSFYFADILALQGWKAKSFVVVFCEKNVKVKVFIAPGRCVWDRLIMYGNAHIHGNERTYDTQFNNVAHQCGFNSFRTTMELYGTQHIRLWLHRQYLTDQCFVGCGIFMGFVWN